MKEFKITEAFGQQIINYIWKSTGNIQDAMAIIEVLRKLKPIEDNADL